jgi:site-specific recombinase XerD
LRLSGIGRSPDAATAEDLRLFQLHQTQIGMQPPSINSAVSALRFFFTVTLDRPDLARRLTVVPYPRRIPAVLSVEEVTHMLGVPPKSSSGATNPCVMSRLTKYATPGLFQTPGSVAFIWHAGTKAGIMRRPGRPSTRRSAARARR